MNWQRVQLKYIARLAYGDAFSSTENEERSSVKVFGSNGPYATSSQANTKAPAIIVGRKGSYGKINWSDDPCFASDTTFFVDQTTTQQHLRWLFYALQTLALDKGTDEAAVPGLNRDDAYKKELPIPPVSQQYAIANYLDYEIGKIDELISAKQRLLELLDDKQQSLIRYAVTRGLNFSTPTEDSGVQWLGRIPVEWKTVKIKHVAQVGNGSTPLRDNDLYWQDGNFPWLTSTVVNNDIVNDPTEFVTATALRECHLPIVPPNSVLVAITGEGKTRGKAALLTYEATINQHMAFIFLHRNTLIPEFLQLVLRGAYDVLRMISEGTGSTKGALTCEQLGEFRVPQPPISEQQHIVSEVASARSQLDSLAEMAKELILLLYKRREAIIAAAVSGQIHITG